MRTGELERGMFYDFAQYRRQRDPDVQDVTIRNEETTFNALFKWAERKALVPFDRVDFEEIKIRDVGRRDTFTMDEYRQLYLALRTDKWLKETYSKHTAKTDYVFCDNETGEFVNKKVFYALWKKALALIGLEKSGRKLSYYSLRHFGITMRRYAGVSFEDISDAAGTSFAFIQNHYSHVDTGCLLEAATKGFTVDKDGFVLRDEISDHHDNKRKKKGVHSIQSLDGAKEHKAPKQTQQEQKSGALGKSEVGEKPWQPPRKP